MMWNVHINIYHHDILPSEYFPNFSSACIRMHAKIKKTFCADKCRQEVIEGTFLIL